MDFTGFNKKLLIHLVIKKNLTKMQSIAHLRRFCNQNKIKAP